MTKDTKEKIFGGLVTLAAVAVIATLVLINENRHKPVPAADYYTCSRDQVVENVHNQPNGISAAIAAHCVLHRGG